MLKIENFNFSGKKTLVRVDFNVPLDAEFNITDDNRMKASLPTIRKIVDDGGIVILMSHLGRPKGAASDKYSLRHLVVHLQRITNAKVIFAANCVGEEAKSAIAKANPGDIVLLENLRFHPEEEKGDQGFSSQLAELGNVYVNDAFGTAHRAHASTTVVASFFPNAKMFGYLLQAEVDNLNKALLSNDRPFTAIIGGAKVSDKVLVIENLLERADTIIVGGAMAYTFFAAQGGSIGNSLVEKDKFPLCLELMNKAKEKGVNILLPVDSKLAASFVNEDSADYAMSGAIPEGKMGLDIGKQAIADFTEVILKSKIVIWNGPMGVFEFSNFSMGTQSVAEALALATKNTGCFTLIGGGDSVAAINKFDLADQVSYVSTGGGAMLEYLEGKTLPGVAAILS